MKIATWYVTTLNHNYYTEILTDEFICFELNLTGVSEIKIPVLENM